MKGILLHIITFITAVSLVGCKLNPNTDKIKPTRVSFKDSVRHYFPIPQGKDLSVFYEYKNTGDHPLAISELQSSCGCAKVSSNSHILEPGGTGVIKVAYDSYKNIGYSQVFITVYMNTVPKQHTLVFDVNIVPEEFSMSDYEKTYKRQKENSLMDEVNTAVEGDETEKGYYLDSTEVSRY